MTDEQIKLVIGALVHDVGKVIYRQGDDKRKHSISGYDYLREEAGIDDSVILNCVKYHHTDALRDANIQDNDIAYISYIADNIASSADRRKNESDDIGFEKSAPLQSVFNILNGNNETKVYSPDLLDPKGKINYPTEQIKSFDEHFYSVVKSNLTDNLRGIEINDEYVNSLLEVMEANLSFVPSSTSQSELMDVSLYDHVKLTAAIASCILEYIKENNIDNYKRMLFDQAEKFYDIDSFVLYSMDVSGIQDFIYTISSEKAMKTLRARSFYLEIMMEHIIDELLFRLGLSRANLIYVGGGHCYILIPNTEKAIDVTKSFNEEVNKWLLDTYKTSLYLADGYCACSCNSLKNVPNGSYEKIFKTISNSISKKKNSRYSPDILRSLNSAKRVAHNRECKVCRRTDLLNEEDKCEICSSIERFSKNILYDDFFVVTLNSKENSIPLPLGCYLSSASEKELVELMQEDNSYVRSYSKNNMYTGKHVSTKLWVGNYTTGKSFGEMAEEATGINRIGVLRADVDNLGHAFVSGFSNEKNENRYVTLSRTATLSRHLSLFFKLYVNNILDNPEYTINGKSKNKRNATICYSGGDDLFIVGAWEDIIELAIDIKNKFEIYSQGMLSISAGIGIYDSSYPISAIANEVAGLEEKSKNIFGKSAITLFEDGEVHIGRNIKNEDAEISDGTYKWDEYIEEVLSDKYIALTEFFDEENERGKNFLYNMLELLRNRKDKINFARYVYLLSRLEPPEYADKSTIAQYRTFSKKMYEWISNDKDSRQLKSAINLYAYMERKAVK